MKKRISILLMLILVLGLTARTPAGEAIRDDLTGITEQVVAVLDIGTDFTDFSSEFTDGIPSRWNLNWTSEMENLSVTCAKDGTITNLYWNYNNNGTFDRFFGYDAAFSSLSSEEADAQAKAWLARLLPEGETARIDLVSEPRRILDSYYYSGTIFYHGLETPMTFSLSLGPDGIISYDRNNCRNDYVGEILTETPVISAETAAESLYQTVCLNLYYMSDGPEAHLYYVPQKQTAIVDALTGEMINMTAWYDSMQVTDPYLMYSEDVPLGMAAADETGSSKRALSEEELASIDKYTDVLSQEELDLAVRHLPALGLAAFTLDRCSYRVDEDETIVAELRYSCDITPDNLFGYSLQTYQQTIEWNDRPNVRKTITVNAHTGSLKQVSTSYSLWEKIKNGYYDLQIAEEFLKAAAPEMADRCAFCPLFDQEPLSGVRFSRVQNGYFFPENYLYVEFNPATNIVDRYFYIWNEDIAFAPSEITVSKEEATALYVDAQEVTLGLSAWPEAINFNAAFLYNENNYIESLKLSYFYGSGNEIRGINAITGEIAETASNQVLTYDDLEETEQKEMILHLARANIGFQGGSFCPDKILTMKDAAILLVCSGDYYEPDNEEDLKAFAVLQGFFTADEWAPEQELTRRQFVHMILQPSRYGYTAELPGLWNGEDGYLQIAVALDMLSDQAAADELCTRAEAAEILYQFMNRTQLTE